MEEGKLVSLIINVSSAIEYVPKEFFLVLGLGLWYIIWSFDFKVHGLLNVSPVMMWVHWAFPLAWGHRSSGMKLHLVKSLVEDWHRRVVQRERGEDSEQPNDEAINILDPEVLQEMADIVREAWAHLPNDVAPDKARLAQFARVLQNMSVHGHREEMLRLGKVYDMNFLIDAIMAAGYFKD